MRVRQILVDRLESCGIVDERASRFRFEVWKVELMAEIDNNVKIRFVEVEVESGVNLDEVKSK